MTNFRQFALDLLDLQTERDQFSNTIIEIRSILGITDNNVWTQDVLREKLNELAVLKGEPTGDLAVVPDVDDEVVEDEVIEVEEDSATVEDKDEEIF